MAPASWNAYARARSLFLQRDPASHGRAFDYIQEAIRIDPSWAEPHALLARWQVLSMFFGADPIEAGRSATEAAETALAIDPTLPDVHLALGYTRYYVDRDWAGSEDALLRAITLNPSDSEARSLYATNLAIWGRHAEALDQARRAVELDPASTLALGQRALVLQLAGRHAEAIQQARESIALSGDYDTGYYHLAWSLYGAGRRKEGAAVIEQALDRFGEDQPWRWKPWAAEYFAFVGDHERARALLIELRDEGAPFYLLGPAVLGLGQNDLAYQAFLQSLGARVAVDPLYGLALPRMAALREHPDFPEILDILSPPESMGLGSAES